MRKTLFLFWLMAFLGLVSASAQVNVTFKVDMSVWAKNGYIKLGTDTVRVAGDFNGWTTKGTNMVRGTGADTSKYSLQVAGVTSGSHSYKFIFINASGVQWENDPNRSATIGSKDTVLPLVFFNDISGKYNHVRFKVDMTGPSRAGKFNPTKDTALVAGSFNGWNNNSKGMTKGASDSIYSIVYDSLTSGSTLYFKYVYRNGAVFWEDDPNRSYLVPEKDSSVFSDYWNRVNPNIPTGSGAINFTVDMSVMQEVGIFNAAKDSARVRGSFNGWGDADPAHPSKMSQNAVTPSKWYTAINLVNEPLGTNELYKYVAMTKDTLWADGWERPSRYGGGNRGVLFTGAASKDTSSWYDDIATDYVIKGGKNIKATFSVNMTDAMDPGKQAVPFVPATDSVFWVNMQPSFTRTQGWRDVDSVKGFKLTATGANNIYTGTLQVKEPSFNSFVYRYGYKHKEANGSYSWIYEPSSFDNFAYRVRYVGQSAARTFPKNPWVMPKDTWQNKAVKTDQEKDPYTSLLGVAPVNSGLPEKYSLSQNYPNPFNPSTVIQFSIARAGYVTLKVFNILGQEVASLVNEEMPAGSYKYEFDASRLSSGVYFYKIQAGSFGQTMKMILLK